MLHQYNGIRPKMRIFATLNAIRGFRKRHLACLETVADYDIALEIGINQEQADPLTMKRLHLLGIASVATVQRRLRRLRQAGAVVQRRSADDRRAVELLLSPALWKIYARYGKVIRAAIIGQPS